MQCPRCGFENIPGATECFRCGAKLLTSLEGKVDTYPPRASERGLRISRRFLDRKIIVPKNLTNVILNIILSIIPGLGHFKINEVKRGIMLFSTSLITLTLTVILFKRQISNYLFALLLFLSFLSVCDVAIIQTKLILKRRFNFYVQFGVVLFVLAGFLSIFAFSAFTLNHFFIFMQVYSHAHYYPPPLHANDRIIAIRKSIFCRNFKRGDLIISRSYGIAGIFRVIGLPQETLKVEGGKIYVNENPLDDRFYPITGELVDNVEITALPQQYIVYQYVVRNNKVVVNLVPIDNYRIKGKAIYIYNPPNRRGRL